MKNCSFFLFLFGSVSCTRLHNNAKGNAVYGGGLQGSNGFFETNTDTPSGPLTGIEVPDDYTIKIKLISPNLSFLYTLATPGAGIVPKKAIEKYGNMRKAFPYTIDRNRIVEDVLNGEAYGPAIYDFCLPAFTGYDITKIKAYDFYCEKSGNYWQKPDIRVGKASQQ